MDPAGLVNIRPLSGPDLEAALPALARLRIDVFRAFPYLYEGSLAYEETYLRTFSAARDALIVAAETDDGVIAGCATGSGMDDQHAEFAQPLKAAGYDLATTFYFGESVLLPAYRGHGIGHAFFDAREAHALAHGRFSPDIAHVQAVALPILRHRLVRNYKAEAEGVTVDRIVTEIL